jgi:hypothetical protein
MAQARYDQNHQARLLLALVPDEVKKSASGAELAARFEQARKLSAAAYDTSLDPLLRGEAKRSAQDLLRAPVAARPAPVRKTTGARKASPQKPTPRRASVKKAGKDDEKPPVAVFDQAGNLIGVCDEADITPIASSSDDAKAAAEVTKQALVYDHRGHPQLVRKGSVARRGEPMAAARSRRDRWIAKAAGTQRQAPGRRAVPRTKR